MINLTNQKAVIDNFGQFPISFMSGPSKFSLLCIITHSYSRFFLFVTSAFLKRQHNPHWLPGIPSWDAMQKFCSNFAPKRKTPTKVTDPKKTLFVPPNRALFSFLFFSSLIDTIIMSGQVSASKAKRLAARAAKAEAKGAKGAGSKRAAAKAAAAAAAGDTTNNDQNGSAVDQLDMKKATINVDRTATGVYTSQERSRDIKIESYSLNYHGRVLIDNATIELNFGRRYGLVGANGSGKSTFLASLAERDIEIPAHIDVNCAAICPD